MILKKINDILYKTTGVFGAACLFGMVVLVFAQVVSRYVFKFSIKWSSELTVYLLTWMVFCGCSMGYRKGEIVGLTMLTDRLPKKVKTVVEILVILLLMFFFVVTFVTNFETIALASHRKSTILHMNLAYVAVSWNVSAGLMFLYAIEKLIGKIGVLAGKPDPEALPEGEEEQNP